MYKNSDQLRLSIFSYQDVVLDHRFFYHSLLLIPLAPLQIVVVHHLVVFFCSL